MASVGSYTVGELYARFYKVTDKGTAFVPLRESLFSKDNLNWFMLPDRGNYIKEISSILDNFLERPEYAHCLPYSKITFNQVMARIDGEAGAIEQNNTWMMLDSIYPLFRSKVNDILIENGIAESIQEINNVLAYYSGRIGSRLPECYAEEDRERLMDFLIIYFTIMLNYEDIFGVYTMNGMDFFEKGRIIIDPNIMLSGDYAERLIHVLSSDDMFLITKYPNLFGMRKDEESVKKVFSILKKIEEDFAPPVLTMTNSNFREEMVKGFIMKLIVDDKGSNSLGEVFALMKKGVGSLVVQMIKDSPDDKKSYIRVQLEQILTDLWAQYEAGLLISYRVVLTRIESFTEKMKTKRIPIKIDSVSRISPSKLRVVFLNEEGIDANTFLSNINAFINDCNNKADITLGGLNSNRIAEINNLIKIVDVRVHP